MSTGLEGQLAAALRENAHVRIRVTCVPAREADVVVQLVVGIPAQHDVAEAQSFLQAGEELLPREILAPEDAVEIEHTDLDVTCAARLDERARLRSRSHFAGLHEVSSATGSAARARGGGRSDPQGQPVEDLAAMNVGIEH